MDYCKASSNTTRNIHPQKDILQLHIMERKEQRAWRPSLLSLFAVLILGCAHGTLAVEPSNVLPAQTCSWKQNSIRNGKQSGPPDPPGCDFQARHPQFLKLLGPAPELKYVAVAAAHEGGVYYPDRNEFYFTTVRVPGQPVQLQKLDLGNKKVSTVVKNTDFANGLVLDADGDLLVCEQGQVGSPAFIERIDLKTLKSETVADNWFNLPFNSPNDAVVKSDKSIWFTDPDYGSVQGFEGAPKVNNQVYRIDPDGTVDVVADGFVKPNGLAFSEDEKLLYVTDSGVATGTGTLDIQRPHSVTVFDVKHGRFLSNRRLFAAVARYNSALLAVPDGIKVDTHGRVYVATGDGIQVFSKHGVPLGLIRVPGAANMGFAGPNLDILYILNDTAIHSVKLQATGAGLPYATKYHGL